MVRALGYVLLTLGVLLLVAPVVLLIWAFQMYSVGFSPDPAPLIAWAVFTLGCIGGGWYVLRRSNHQKPSPDGRGVKTAT